MSEKYGHEFDAIQIHTKNDCSHLPDNQHDQDTDLLLFWEKALRNFGYNISFIV